MRNYLISYLLILSCAVCPVSMLFAGESTADALAVQNRANELKTLLDHLLLDTNHSSIQKIIKEGDEPTKALIAEALRLKSTGEQLLSEKKYMEAAVSLQSALDNVFQAIRQDDGTTELPDALNTRLAENITVNDTFLSTAERVVTGEQNQDALKLLAMAKEERNRADTESGAGESEAALLTLEHSTRLAQQAIMSVRNGKVIERGQ